MSLDQNLVLTGFMGTGKTAVGRELAMKLGMEFVDTDELIESRHGPIAGIFDDKGEAAFRVIECGVAIELGRRRGLVIATGGRMMLDPSNANELTRHGRVFRLIAAPEEIHRRIVDDPSRKDRPLLRDDDPKQRIIELMADRESDYARFEQVVTDGRSPGEIVDELVALWHRQI